MFLNFFKKKNINYFFKINRSSVYHNSFFNKKSFISVGHKHYCNNAFDNYVSKNKLNIKNINRVLEVLHNNDDNIKNIIKINNNNNLEVSVLEKLNYDKLYFLNNFYYTFIFSVIINNS